MLTEKDYCDYDTCVALEELGFREPTLTHYMENYPNNLIYHQCDDACVKDCYRRVSSRDGVFGAPTLYEAQKWLREEKDINVYVEAFNGEGWYYIIQNYKGARIYPPLTRILVLCHSYEEALLEGLKEAVKILKED